MEVGVGLKPVCVVRSRPVPIHEIPAAVDQYLGVREDLEVADSPRLNATGVEAGRELADIRGAPRADEAALGGPLDGVHVFGRQQPTAPSGGRHQPVGTVELEMPTSES